MKWNLDILCKNCQKSSITTHTPFDFTEKTDPPQRGENGYRYFMVEDIVKLQRLYSTEKWALQ